MPAPFDGSSNRKLLRSTRKKDKKMIELCKINRLKVVRDTPQGLYLESDINEKTENCQEEKKESSGTERSIKDKNASAARFTGSREDVLLPRTEVPDGIKPGDELDVFIYLDSSDRYTATLKTPGICLGAPALLKVSQVTDIGVFLDWGLDKNLLLPFSGVVRPFYYDPLGNNKDHDLKADGGGSLSAEPALNGRMAHGGQSSVRSKGERVKLDGSEIAWLEEEGRELPVVLYIDKSGRPAASMRVYDHLSVGGEYKTDSAIEAVVVQINPQLGIFVAVDDRYYGMININEITDKVSVGDRIFGRVSGIRDDGKYMVSLTRKVYLQMDNDAQTIYSRLKNRGGVLPLGDKSDAADIMKELGMSKKAFKRAVGQLYKEGKVVPGEHEVRSV